LRAIGSPAIATVVDSNRDRPPDPGRERARQIALSISGREVATNARDTSSAIP